MPTAAILENIKKRSQIVSLSIYRFLFFLLLLQFFSLLRALSFMFYKFITLLYYIMLYLAHTRAAGVIIYIYILKRYVCTYLRIGKNNVASTRLHNA